MTPNLSIIGNVSKSTGILILNGENDSQTPVQQAFLLQQRLTDVNHPDHTLITYPNLGHAFYPSSPLVKGELHHISNHMVIGQLVYDVLDDNQKSLFRQLAMSPEIWSYVNTNGGMICDMYIKK